MIRAVLIISVSFFLSGCGEGYPPQSNGRVVQPYTPPPTPKERYQQHVAIARSARYRKKRLLNKGEERLFRALVKASKANDYRVFSQVSLGEILNADGDAFSVINSKRVDFCLTDKNFYPIAMIEYYGSGHDDETSKERDEVKKKAAENAGITYHVVYERNISIMDQHIREKLLPKLALTRNSNRHPSSAAEL
ncbi:DUF2726 domain-containing protein [Candidatus Thiosymbion oneisti]|uniref:DUF2726 domain-containing protein n=1 Tax=Candidatus Thiosymbion oneisti TaxID=589554 RepID=UPI00105C692E|nr:DUF2726 domain-containing protein [Candidatus Thiosymbion oneisti]